MSEQNFDEGSMDSTEGMDVESTENESGDTYATDQLPVDESEQDTSTKETSNEKSEKEVEEKKIAEEFLKLKVNGEEMDYNIADRERLVQDLQQSFAAQQKFQKAAEIQRNMESLQSQLQQLGHQLKQNPMQVLQSLGLDAQRVAEQYLEPLYARMDMPEHERIALEQREQMELMHQRIQEYERQEAQRQEQELLNKRAEHYRMQISDFIKQNNLPDTEDTLYYIATAYNRALDQNPNARLQDILPNVQSTMRQNIGSFIGGLDGDDLISALGKDTADKIRKHFLKQSKSSRSKHRTGAKFASGKASQQEPRKVSGDASIREQLGL